MCGCQLGLVAPAPYDGGEISFGPSVQTSEEIVDWVCRDAETALHPSCTTRMGTDRMSVLAPATMAVQGLRVVDASAMPYVTNGKRQAMDLGRAGHAGPRTRTGLGLSVPDDYRSSCRRSSV